MSIATSI